MYELLQSLSILASVPVTVKFKWRICSMCCLLAICLTFRIYSGLHLYFRRAVTVKITYYYGLMLFGWNLCATSTKHTQRERERGDCSLNRMHVVCERICTFDSFMTLNCGKYCKRFVQLVWKIKKRIRNEPNRLERIRGMCAWARARARTPKQWQSEINRSSETMCVENHEIKANIAPR